MSSLNVCEYCGDGTPQYSRVWRKVVDHSDGTRQEVWCCDECWNDEAGGGEAERIEVLATETNDEDEDEIIDISDE